MGGTIIVFLLYTKRFLFLVLKMLIISLSDFNLYIMNKLLRTQTFLVITLSLITLVECYAESGVYVGGHIRRERPGTIDKLKKSGFTYVILFNVHVEANGTLTTDGETICENGEYVFHRIQPHYVNDVASLKQGSTSITRVETCIGGWTNQSWYNIKSLVESEGTGQNSILYKNFQALKNALPTIDAVNNDDEHAYDVNSAIAFHVMLYDLGFHSTMAPYRNKSYWQKLIEDVNEQRPGAVYRVYIQCYGGGSGNNPADWHLGGLPLHAGRENYQNYTESLSLMESWKKDCGVSGGFFWVYNDESWNLNNYAIGVNKIFYAAENPVATLYGASGFRGVGYPLPIGEYTTPQLAACGISDNWISSIKILPGYRVTVYESDDFLGKTEEYTSDSNISGIRVSSLKIESTTSSLDETALPVQCIYNAAQKMILIKSETTDVVNIFNLSGQIVHTNKIQSGETKIDASTFNKGLYLVRLSLQDSAFKISL